MATVDLDGSLISVTGRILKCTEIFDEYWLDPDRIPNPEHTIAKLRERGGADLFSFSQHLPDLTPNHSYPMEWDNLAAVRITGFDDWWNGLPQATRKNVRRSAKRGVEIRPATLDDELVRGIVKIYNETPIRQGRRFPHYGKDFDQTQAANSSYLERSDFIGAYLKGELIGFMKLVYVGKQAKIMQIVALAEHQDKRPMNAMIAKAMEIVSAKGMDYFIYGKYIYGKRTDTQIIEFKNRNGFEKLELPKYYVPLTPKGALALKLGLHHGLTHLLPAPLIGKLSDLRSRWYELVLKQGQPATARPASADDE
jgi:hypothetical protein